MRVFFHGLSCTKSRSNASIFRGVSCTKPCSNACFFSRFVVHKIVLQCVFFFFPPGFVVHQIVLQCVCFSFSGFVVRQVVLQRVFFFSGFVVHQIVLYGLNYVESPCSCYYFSRALKVKKCGKTKNWRFCIGFLLGASTRIWPEQSQPPKPRRILNTAE